MENQAKTMLALRDRWVLRHVCRNLGWRMSISFEATLRSAVLDVHFLGRRLGSRRGVRLGELDSNLADAVVSERTAICDELGELDARPQLVSSELVGRSLELGELGADLLEANVARAGLRIAQDDLARQGSILVAAFPASAADTRRVIQRVVPTALLVRVPVLGTRACHDTIPLVHVGHKRVYPDSDTEGRHHEKGEHEEKRCRRVACRLFVLVVLAALAGVVDAVLGTARRTDRAVLVGRLLGDGIPSLRRCIQCPVEPSGKSNHRGSFSSRCATTSIPL